MRYIILFSACLVFVNCTTNKTAMLPQSNVDRSVSNTDLSQQDAHQIDVWSEKTEEGTQIGELPEYNPNDESVNLVDMMNEEMMGVSGLIHQAALRCSVLHITVNESASPQTLSAKCDDRQVFGPVLTSTGKGGSTPNGTFTVYNKLFMANSGSYNNAPMPRFLVFKSCPPKKKGGAVRLNCIGIHATVKKNYQFLGSMASHGCVRLTMENAVALWAIANDSGTVKVTVQ